jgi:DNA-binding transcriptional LysR family regulator
LIVNPPRFAAKLSLRQIEAFRAVVLSGTVSKGAERMHVSQPAVSRLIADLEQAVGFTVFDRKRRFQLTEEGKLLYREVDQSFIGIDKIGQRAEEICKFRTGHIRVAASPALGLGLLPAVIKDFRAAFHDVTISTQVRASQSVAEWVASGQLDLGYAALPINQGGVSTRPLQPLPALCMVPRRHKLARCSMITPLMLAEEHLISLGPESSLRTSIDLVFHRAGVTMTSSVETTMSAHAAVLVREGLGIALIDPLTALAFVYPDLVLKPFQPTVPFEFAQLTPEHIGPSRLALAFIERADAVLERARQRIGLLYGMAKARPKRRNQAM